MSTSVRSTRHSDIRIGKEVGDLAEETLRFFRQIGVEVVGIPTRYTMQAGTTPTVRPLIPPTQTGRRKNPLNRWDEHELRKNLERIASFGLKPASANLQLSGNIVLGQPGRDEDLESMNANIALAGRLGIRVLTYSFTALRASEGYGSRPGGGRGGATLRDFDYDRINQLPPYAELGEQGLERMWARIRYFLDAALPVAESAGVRLAAHPNDPPVPVYRGVAQPLSDLAGLARLVSLVDSPANSLFFDTGVTTEMGEDAAAAIRHFGGKQRIAAVHFRNVHVEIPRYKYVETFHDDGDCDMAASIQALHETGYRGPIFPDHTPHISDDLPATRSGWAFAIGQMIGLRAALTR